MSSYPPTDNDLKQAASDLRAQNPLLGLAKLLALLKERHPEWAVSEKRFRKFAQSKTGADDDVQKVGSEDLPAETGLDGAIDISRVAPKVEARLLGKAKGKGLVARGGLLQGEVIWQEEPWIATADSLVSLSTRVAIAYRMQQASPILERRRDVRPVSYPFPSTQSAIIDSLRRMLDGPLLQSTLSRAFEEVGRPSRSVMSGSEPCVHPPHAVHYLDSGSPSGRGRSNHRDLESGSGDRGCGGHAGP